MKKLILTTAILAATLCGCEKLCKAKITSNDTAHHEFTVDGKPAWINYNDIYKVKKGSIVKLDGNIYVIEDCETYVIVRKNFTDYLLKY